MTIDDLVELVEGADDDDLATLRSLILSPLTGSMAAVVDEGSEYRATEPTHRDPTMRRTEQALAGRPRRLR